MKLARSIRKPIAALRRLAASNAVRVPALCGLFAALLTVTIYYAREPATLSQAGGMRGLDGIAGTDTAARGLSVEVGADDPVAQFSRTGVGQVLFPSPVSDSCRRVLFDNRTGGSYEVGRIFCGQVPDRLDEGTGTDRIQALRKSFQKGATVQ